MWLCDRKHFVSISKFHITAVISGIPQGNILGLLLFLVYVNDIPTSMYKCTTYLFADDTKILKPIHNPNNECELQEDIDTLLSWCKKWKMSLHPEKCAAMRYTLSHHQQPNYTLEGYSVQPLDQHCDLGVFLLTDLS